MTTGKSLGSATSLETAKGVLVDRPVLPPQETIQEVQEVQEVVSHGL